MKSRKKDRNALRFRPSMSESSLESRVVLSSFARMSGPVNIRFLQVGAPGPAARISGAGIRAQAAIHAQQANAQQFRQSRVMIRQLRQNFIGQFHTALKDLRTMIRAQSAQLFANGTPTAQQIVDFNQFLNGAINATAFRVSSMAALLPGASTGLVPRIQQSFLGTGPTSLVSRIQSMVNNPRITTAAAINQATTAQLVRNFQFNQAQLGNFFNTTNFNRLSVDQNGQPIPLNQFIGNGIVTQFGNTLGSLAQGVPILAGTSLFANGVATPSLPAQQAFAQQLGQALGLAAFQLGGNLSLFPNASTTLIPQLQPLLFGTSVGTGTTSPSLLAALQGVPLSSTAFNPAVSSAFTSVFPNIVNPINSFFGLTPLTTPTLPTGTIPSIFTQPFVNFGTGFNSGFGTGFPGFGTLPTNFNTNFGTGFFNMITGLNPTFGFNVPSFAFSQPTLGLTQPFLGFTQPSLGLPPIA